MLTVEDVHAYIVRIGVGGQAGVKPGITLGCFLDEQAAGGYRALFRHQADTTAWRIEIDRYRIMWPHHRRRWFGGVLHQARQIDRRAQVDEQVRTSKDFCYWF